jgi:hypothetical protein
MALCSTCQAFDIQSFGQNPFLTRGFRLLDVERRAKSTRCTFCCFLCDALEPARQQVQQQREALVKSNSAWKDPWIHLQMSKDNHWMTGRRWKTGGPLHINRLNIFISPRHIHNTIIAIDKGQIDSERSLEALCRGAVICRVLADQGTSFSDEPIHFSPDLRDYQRVPHIKAQM